MKSRNWRKIMLIRYLVPHNASKELCNAMLLIVFHYSQSTLSFSLKKKFIYMPWHSMLPNHMSSPSLSYNVHPSVKHEASTGVGELSWRHGYSLGLAYWKLDTTFSSSSSSFISFFKGFKLRSLSLSPSRMWGFQSHFARNWWRWDAKAKFGYSNQ